MNHIARVKVMTLGNSQTGKSCLVKRYCERRFVPKYLPTIGIDYGCTRVAVDKVDARVHIFDTSGRPLFADVRSEFYAGMAGVLLVYDVTDRASFAALDDWLQELGWSAASDPPQQGAAADAAAATAAAASPDPPPPRPVLVVAANKTDRTPREITEEEGVRWADRHGAAIYNVSASSGHGVTQLFDEFFQMAVRAASSCRHHEAATAGAGGAAYNMASWLRRIRAAPNDWDKLGLRPGYSRDDVNRAYKSLAVMLHPDKNNSPEAAEAFKIITTVKNNLLKTFPP